MRLSKAPGRRRTSMTSLATKAVVRVQLLSSPRNSSLTLASLGVSLSLSALALFSTADQDRKHLVERRQVLAAGGDRATRRLDGFHQPRGDGCRVVRDDLELAWRALTHLADTR